MAYDANTHNQWAQRVTGLMRTVWQLKQEAETLDEIYTEESASGTDPDFGDTSNNTEQELIDAVTFMRLIKPLCDGSSAISQTDRTANITPFLAGE